MGKYCFICEKNTQAKMVAQAYNYTHKGNYYEIHPCSTFPDGAYVAYAAGHLLQIKEPHELNSSWKEWRLDTLPLNPASMSKKVDSTKKRLLQTIKQLANKSSIIVNAGDIDIEGSYLVHEIILFLGIKKPLKRLWLTSLTPNAIRKSVNKMKDFSESEYMYWQGLSRSEADWLFGMNFSRQFTLLLSKKSQLKNKTFPVKNKKTSNVFSVGRIQTVVNHLIYQREISIENFVSEKYWDIYASFRIAGHEYSGKWFIPDWDHIFYKEQADFLINELREKPASILDVKKEIKHIRPPQFFNLTSLQKKVDKVMGLSPDQTLSEIQKLYLEGYVSYPRTQIVYVGEEEAKTFEQVLSNLAELNEFKTLLPAPVKDISNDTRYINSSKVQEHHGIIPTEKKVDWEKLNNNQKVIYSLIAKSLIAAHYKDVVVNEVVIATLVNEQYTFRSKGSQVVEKGWYQVIPSQKEDVLLPDVQTGEKGSVISVDTKEGKTKPLSRWSEADIVVMMANAYKELPNGIRSEYSKDELSLGTVATRAETVKGLKQRGYIEVKKNKVFITTKGRILATAMENIPLFTSPLTTGNMQKHINEEIKDYASYQKFLKGIRTRVALTYEEALKQSTIWDFSSIGLDKLPQKGKLKFEKNL